MSFQPPTFARPTAGNKRPIAGNKQTNKQTHRNARDCLQDIRHAVRINSCIRQTSQDDRFDHRVELENATYINVNDII
jgi:hypothetical protein